jgi:hypothetical protein
VHVNRRRVGGRAGRREGVVVAQLQETFEATGRMLWARGVIAVGKEEDEAWREEGREGGREGGREEGRKENERID